MSEIIYFLYRNKIYSRAFSLTIKFNNYRNNLIYIFTKQIVLSLVFLAVGYENISPFLYPLYLLSLGRFCFGSHSSGMQAFFSLFLFLPRTLPSRYYFLLAPIQSQPVDVTRWITTFVDADAPENSYTRKSFYLRRDIITFT